MGNLIWKLNLGGATAALLAAAAILPSAADAQTQGEGGGVEQVVVTGTNLRGVAPVGSHVASITQADIEAIAPVSVSQVLSTLPQLSNAGTAAQGENSYTFYSPNIHNLAASASNSTLVVVDGMRIPGGGPQWAEADPNIVPVIALQRVEVLADGASSVYGSDAVSGVVNFITRRNFDGLQGNVQFGAGDDYQTENASLLWGTHWDGGNVYFATSYTYGSNIPITARNYLTLGNFTPVGGTNQNQTQCSPASLHPTSPVAGSGSSYWYQGPGATTGYANSQPARPCNNEVYGGDLIPRIRRINAMTRISQDFFGGRLNISDTLLYNDLHTNQRAPAGTITANAYGTVNGVSSGVAGQQNPFFQDPAGALNTTAEQIAWVDLLDPLPILTSTEDVIYNRIDANYTISDNWHAELDWVMGQNNYMNGTTNGFCTSCAYQALNGTSLSNGSTTQTDVAGHQVVSLNLPLTAANALDVWNPAGTANKTSAAVIRSLASNNATQNIYNSTNQMRASIDGTLFDLPGGPVKAAFGAELYYQHIIKDNVAANNTGAGSYGSALTRYHYHRVVYSTFAEVQVPIISPQMDVPLVQAFSIDISGRYDKFSDVGPTSNPKFAMDWQITDGLKFRANYSTSFVAPPLLSIGDPSLGYMYAGGASTGAEIDSLPAANFPGIAQIPGAVCTVGGAASSTPASTGCPFVTLGNTPGTNGTGGNQGLERQMGGGFVNVKPETGLAWSLGVDFSPTWLPGLTTSVTLFNSTFKGAVNAAHIQQTANIPSLNHFLTICPTACTQTQVDAFTNTGNGATTGALPAGGIYYLWAHDETNFLYLKVQGVDLDANYTWDAGDWGAFHLGDYATIFTQFQEGYDGLNYFSIMNSSGFNGTFASVQYNTRGNVGWAGGPIVADLFVNFTPSYRNWNSTAVHPLITSATGAVLGGGDVVHSWTTLDINLAYNFVDGWLGGDQVYLHVNNIFDRNPPFINTTANGTGASSNAAFGFNAFNASPIGRTVEVGMTAKL
jgi:iron complex outermembrane receptor protein